MRRALALARRAQGYVEPNPMVGAVLVKNGRLIAEGYHHRFGGPHAEVVALHSAGRKAQGATLYVTLEPCCHWGKTPPCTDALLAADVARVVVAMVDPFAKVHGRGIAILRRARIRVEVGLLEADARALNSPFLTRLVKRRPHIIAKWAQSLDGCLSPPAARTRPGRPHWISSQESRAWVHTLRGRMDGILIGIGTALQDDPLLTARLSQGHVRRLATRIVLDSQCRLPPASQLVRTIPVAPLLVAHAERLGPAAETRRRTLQAKGVMTAPVPVRAGKLHLPAFLRHLADLDYTNVLVEGGSEILTSFFREDLIDEAHLFLAPILLGGQNAPRPFFYSDVKDNRDARAFQIASTVRRGPDLHLTLVPK